MTKRKECELRYMRKRADKWETKGKRRGKGEKGSRSEEMTQGEQERKENEIWENRRTKGERFFKKEDEKMIC